MTTLTEILNNDIKFIWFTKKKKDIKFISHRMRNPTQGQQLSIFPKPSKF